MSKIIRLTESDLKRLIEMVSEEMNKTLNESIESKTRIIYEDEYGSVEETAMMVIQSTNDSRVEEMLPNVN